MKCIKPFLSLSVALLAPMILLGACGSSPEAGSSLASETTSTFSEKEAFKNDGNVKSAVQALMAAGYLQDGADVSDIEIGGDCGFAGCDSTRLIALSFNTPGANTRSASVAAIVKKPAHPSLGTVVVQLVEIKAVGTGEKITVDSRNVVEAFRKSKLIMQETSLRLAQGHILDGEPSTLIVGGACGFFGCETKILVTQNFRTGGANTQSSSISAIVEDSAPLSTNVLKVYLAAFSPIVAPQNASSDEYLLSCVARASDGAFWELELFKNAEGNGYAKLVPGNAQAADLTICQEHNPAGNLPGGITTCNNLEFNDRWNVAFIAGIGQNGSTGVAATLSHNESEVATLQCVRPVIN